METSTATPRRFRIVDVSGERIITAAVFVAVRQHSTGQPSNASHLAKSMNVGVQQAGNALAMAAELRLLERAEGTQYRFTGDADLRIAPKSALPLFFRQALQQYPPLLLFASFLHRGYTVSEAGPFVVSAFDIGLDAQRTGRAFVAWMSFCGMVNAAGAVDFTPSELLDLGFLARLSDALRDELSTRMFVIDEIGQAAAGELYGQGIDLDGISRALIKHKSEPKDALREAGNVLEEYLAMVSKRHGGPGSELGKLVDYLQGESRRVILKTHRNVGYGAGGFRNAADHGGDPQTGISWTLSTEAALVGSLTSLLLLKSIVRFLADGTQII